jgi:hypothetical protein
MPNHPILAPMCGMVFLTLLVWLWMYYTRLTTIARSGKDPQILADEARATALLKDVVNPSDNFENLFEMPVLFYVAVLTIFVSGMSDEIFVKMAWGYVILRALHSLIHCSYNRIVHRFAAYAVSSLVVWGMWVRIAMRICGSHGAL